MYKGPSMLLMMLRSLFFFFGLFLIFTFIFFNNQGAWLVPQIKIWTCGWDVGPLNLNPSCTCWLSKVNCSKMICLCDNRSAHSCKNYAQHRCRTQTSCEYIGCFRDSLRTGSRGCVVNAEPKLAAEEGVVRSSIIQHHQTRTITWCQQARLKKYLASWAALLWLEFNP